MAGVHERLKRYTISIRKGDKVIVTGLQRVQPGMTVEPKKIPMPAPPSGAAAK